MMKTAGFHHFAIKVRNLLAAERFYSDVLGLTVDRRWPAADGAGDRSVWLALGGDGSVDGGRSGEAGGTAFLALEVIVGSSPEPAAASEGARPGHHLFALRIRRDERGRWEERLAAAGVTVTHRSAYTLYFTDPEGNRLGLSHYPEPMDPL